MKILRGTFFALLFAALALPAFAAESPWARVVVIGASASGGFVLSEPFGGTNTTKCKLHNYLDAAIVSPHAPVKNFGTAMFFLSPDAMAVQEVQAATNAQPTLVVAVDFLFWFCYGAEDSEAARVQHFEHGLKLLEQIPCPLIVGDIPDASSATNSGIIGSEQVPSEATRRAANERLKQWAAAHPHVTIVPLAEFMRQVKANEAVKLRTGTLPAGSTRSLLQADGLHPTPRGAAVLSLGIWDAFLKAHPKISAKEINWDANQVLREGLKKAAP
ncbi:MAG TPA: SGNH/GDSL hydrolase family protein [Candidatus Acidoferrales bacterium]|jgi:hypothetical protein|nr:SGNH/GDSL hydrolase family protein [Candidatus Acidoferrales bacterium]